MFSLRFSHFFLLKNSLNEINENEEALTTKEKFALIWLLLAGIIIGTFFLMWLYIVITTSEFGFLSFEFGAMG